MSTKTKEVQEFVPHVEADEHLGYDAQEAANFVLKYLEHHGGTLYVLESTYWGSEALGEWIEMFIADPSIETDDGIRVQDVTKVSGVLAILNEYYQAKNELTTIKDPDQESKYESIGRSRWENQMEAAIQKMWHGVGVDHEKSDWFPKSKIVYETSRRGRPDHIIFSEDGRERGVKDDAECVISDTTLVRSKYATYDKLAIDVPYNEDKNPKEFFDWETHHFTAKYKNNNFQCWTADKDPRTIAKILAKHYDGCAVHEKLLDNYDD